MQNTHMDQQTLHDRLHAAFKDRNIPCDRSHLDAALHDPVNAQWADANLRPETLLTKEELRLYNSISVQQSPNLPSTRPLLDHELASAIDALRCSTTSIDAQTQVLNAQCRELRTVLDKEGRDAVRREDVLRRFAGRNAGEVEGVGAQVEELSREFASRLDKTRGLLEAENMALAPGVARMLREHDMMLHGFEELASRLEEGDGDGDGDDGLEERAAKLSARLGGVLAEEIQCRLDRLYLECAVAEGSGVGDDAQGDAGGQIAGLEEEIGSLHSEIDVLAHMASQERFQGRVSQAVRQKRELADSTTGRQLDHILNTMGHFTVLTDRLSERIQTRQSHILAVNALANAEQRARQTPRPKAAPKHQHQSVLEIRKAATHRRSSSIPNHYQHQQPSLDLILRRFNISLPALLKSPSAAAPQAILQSKKEAMLQILTDNYLATPSPLIPYLEEADKTTQFLASSLYSDPRFPVPVPAEGGGGERERTMARLEGQIEDLRKRVEGVDFDAESLKRDPEKERFLERWA